MLCFAGGFWISFGFISLPASGISQAYEGDPQMFNNALGMYLVGWTIFTTLMFICALRTNLVLIAAFFTLDLTYIMLDCYQFTGEIIFNKIGGILGGKFQNTSLVLVIRGVIKHILCSNLFSDYCLHCVVSRMRSATNKGNVVLYSSSWR